MTKRKICGGMGFGYGSKYQLLRMLGWHRDYFNKQIAEASKTSNEISWLDFKFDGPEDKELLNASFLDKQIETEWEKIWPTNRGRCGINWDAVGISNSTYILVEAKAHKNECDAGKDGGGKNPKEAIDSITKFQKKYGIKEMNWLCKEYYQLANRLIFTDFLLERGINAKLVYVLFLNGYEFNTKNGEAKSVSDKQEWIDKFEEMKTEMGIKGTGAEDFLHLCFVNCN